MAVIKHDQAGSEVAEARFPVLEDLDARLQDMVTAAQRTAETIIDTARTEARALEEAACRKGHAEGLEAGRAQGREAALQETSQRVEETCDAWTSMLERWETDRVMQLRQAEDGLMGTALQLAESIVRRSIVVDPTVVRGPLQSALELVRRPTDVVVQVHPEDHAFVAEILEDVVSSMASCASTRIQIDDEIERGGCRLDLEGGHVDATVATQLERIAAVLLPNPGVAP